MLNYQNRAPISGVIPAAVIAAGLAGPVAWSAPGDLDPAFGDMGFAELPQDLSGAIWALEAINDGYKAAGGVEYCGYYYSYCNADADFATSLSGTGVADPEYRPAIPAGVKRPVLAWQKDGRLVGVGWATTNSGSSYMIFRLATDGSLDPTFGTDGAVTFDLAMIDAVQGVIVDPDGRIVIAGMQVGTSVLLRLMPDGSWDPSFGTNGVAGAAVSGHDFWPAGIVQTPAGTYRMVGADQSGCNVRGVTESGSVDNGFGNSGSVGLASAVGSAFQCAHLNVLADGRLLVAGWDNAGGEVVRLSANGDLDATFTTDAGSYLSKISAMTVSASGSVFVAGPDRDGLPGTVVSRLLPEGPVDTGFGAGGKAWVDVPGGIGVYADARVLVAPNDDQILVGGLQGPAYWYSGPYVARLTMSGAGPGVIGIKTTAVQARESERQATIVVRRTGGSTGAVSVGYRTEVPASIGIAATEGLDFAATQGRLEWASGDADDKTIVVPILGDQVEYEGSEQFVVTLEDPSGGGLGKSAGLVTILGDGYPYGAFRIIAATPNVEESAAAATFYVSRIDGGSGAVSVTVEPVAGTATQGTDFEAGPVTLAWADGEMSDKVVTVRITKDRIRESDETFSMVLANPTGGSVIVPDQASASVTIQDSTSSGGKSGGGMVGLTSLLLLGFGALARRLRTALAALVPVLRFR
jgi:uncharacterized delta-60 repeat protein